MTEPVGYVSVPEQAARRLKIDAWLRREENNLSRIQRKIKDPNSLVTGERLFLIEKRETCRIKIKTLRKVLDILRDETPLT